MGKTRTPGKILWTDLTVEDATSLRDFYAGVVGWTSEGFDMDGYHDYNMIPPGETSPVAGICHARGGNAGLPPYWLIYLSVEDLGKSIRRCRELGGEVVSPPREMPGHGRYCVIQDPAGAVAALFEQES